MKKLEQSSDGVLIFNCPGCGENHGVYVRPHKNPVNGASWNWNGSMDAPTFTPSILRRSVFSDPNRPNSCCHSYVTDGRIQFLTDSTHPLAGQTVDLPSRE